MSVTSRILLIGYGNMGRALTEGWLARGRAADAIRVIDPSADARSAASHRGLVAAQAYAPDPGFTPDVVVVAVKPGQVRDCLRGVDALAPRPVFLSIAAGKRIASFTKLLGAAPIVRAMPNTPAAIGQGMTVLCPNETVTSAQRALCEELLGVVGATAWVEDETLMDAVTALSGSGPAYVFLLIESLIAAGESLGLEPELARQLAGQTVAGAGAYAVAADAPAAELRRRVTSPGGTTEAALAVLMAANGGLPSLIRAALERAAARSRELSAD
jgi:pyrroline-5-carboxylate reductase